MQMTFEASSSVTLLFDCWDVRGPKGMALSVLVVTLLTVFYELLKVWRVRLSDGSERPPAAAGAAPHCSESCSVLEGGPSESSLAPIASQPRRVSNSWGLHALQTGLHVLQVSLGYMLMLCVMSYNVWIFLGVIVGSVLGYYVSFPLLPLLGGIRC